MQRVAMGGEFPKFSCGQPSQYSSKFGGCGSLFKVVLLGLIYSFIIQHHNMT